jgi:hypothetical protein
VSKSERNIFYVGSQGGMDDVGDNVDLKVEALLELEIMKSHGIRMTRDYTVHDRLCEIQFEIRKQLLMEEERASIASMRGAIVVASKLVEVFNVKMGSPLELTGWSREVRRNGSSFDAALSRIHRKYQRRSNTAPEVALAMGLISSVGMYHLKKTGADVIASQFEGQL